MSCKRDLLISLPGCAWLNVTLYGYSIFEYVNINEIIWTTEALKNSAVQLLPVNWPRLLKILVREL